MRDYSGFMHEDDTSLDVMEESIISVNLPGRTHASLNQQIADSAPGWDLAGFDPVTPHHHH
ncbi:hypothetical protein [Candidatus Pantoea multigeneris]|uniref:Uncharacterized protein n=1 Tax=Candidatus Pantoea multigeneris TaxID=2608357 RepID=A0ABX0R523_9GAMM|nr:hypothetical protein [Pantoea multigeneris]NIF20187.1 hypothetical protein [Pantoea multigeneris]